MKEFRLDKFDSEIFGCDVYRLLAEADTLSPERLRSMREGTQACFICCFTPHSPGNFEALADSGFRLISVRSSYELDIGPDARQASVPPGITIDRHTESPVAIPDAQLAELALTIGASSRYFKDRRVPPSIARALYLRWLQNSLRGGYAAEVLIASAQGRVVGLHSIRVDGPRGIVDLIGVVPACQGTGVGRALLDEGIAWCARRGLSHVEVVTEAENIAASRFYERRGFMLRRTEFVWHWHAGSLGRDVRS